VTPSDSTYERSVYKKARESKRSAVAKPERDIRCVIRDPLAGIKSLRESLRGRGAGARTFSLLRAAFALACEKRHARRFFGFPSRGAPPLVAASASSRGTHGGMDRERGRRLRDALPRRGRLRSGRGMARVAGVQRGARGDDSRVRLFFFRANQSKPLASSPRTRSPLRRPERAVRHKRASHASLFLRTVFLYRKRRRVSLGGGR
jgi:hypothetical protein